MLKKIILPSLSIFLFTACSLKMPEFSMPSFLSFSDDKDAIALEKAKKARPWVFQDIRA